MELETKLIINLLFSIYETNNFMITMLSDAMSDKLSKDSLAHIMEHAEICTKQMKLYQQLISQLTDEIKERNK